MDIPLHYREIAASKDNKPVSNLSIKKGSKVKINCNIILPGNKKVPHF